jgi:diguanylate cyclase (GGDEF)-like protein
MLDLALDEIRMIAHQLEQAIYNHEQWSKRLIKTLICHTLPDDHDIAIDAHKRCQFGQWYFNHASPMLLKQPGFVALGNEHQRMHEQAAQLLRNTVTGAAISRHDYDDFENVLDRMRLQVHTLLRECTEAMYNRDPLTETSSRLGLLTSLRENHELAKRGIQVCSIAMMDLDYFKAINDQFGHSAGDKVLCASAAYLMKNSRSYDKVFRYGGEEFVICMPGLSHEQALGLVERLRQGIAENAVVHDGQQIRATASFGIAALDPRIPVEDCLEHADKALYAAKAAGRNCSRAWSEGTITLPPLAEPAGGEARGDSQ